MTSTESDRGGLHRALATHWALSEAVRTKLLAALGSVPRTHWTARPSSGRWSAAEHADHLLKSEVGTSKLVRRLVRGDFDGAKPPAGATVYDSTLDAYPFPPVGAPAFLQPEILDFGAIHEGLQAAHARFLAELRRFEGPDPDAVAAPDPATALWFTLAGWVRVQALHEAHHVLQIEALIRELRGERADRGDRSSRSPR